MKTYEQARKEYDKEIQEAQDRIKSIKATKTFDFHCPQCNKIKKMLVIRKRQGKEGLKYCSAYCRHQAYTNRKRAKLLNKLGLAEEKIYELEQQIKELKNEKR